MANRYVTGDTVTLGNTFRVNGTPTAPTTVALAVTDPAGTTTTYSSGFTNPSTGVYSKDVTATSAGIWRFTWTGTGTAADVQDSSFRVFTPAEYRNYCTIEQVKNRLRITDPDDDLDIQTAIGAASRQIERHCGQRFWMDLTATAQTYFPTDPFTLDLCDDEDKIATATGLIVKVDSNDDGSFETTLTIGTDFQLFPQNAALRWPAEPYTEIRLLTTGTTTFFYRSIYHRPTIQVTAHFGWPEIPDEIEMACIMQATQLFRSRESVFGAQALGDSGVAAFAQGLDRQARDLISPYAHVAVG